MEVTRPLRGRSICRLSPQSKVVLFPLGSSQLVGVRNSATGLTTRTPVETLDEATDTVAAAATTEDCGKSGPGTGAKLTSEAKLGEKKKKKKKKKKHAGIAKTHKNKGISPDFGVEPGLDRMKTKPNRARGPSFKTRVSNLKTQVSKLEFQNSSLKSESQISSLKTRGQGR